MKFILKNKLHVYGLSPDLKKELSQSFTILNPRWLENNRMGRWNYGTPKLLKFYRLLPKSGIQIPRGYIGQLMRHCRQQNIIYQVEDKRRSFKPLDFHFQGQLRAYQKPAVEKMLSKDFGTLNAPTGAGKTFMALKMVAARQQPTLIIVHTRELALQWQKRVAEHLSLPSGEIGFIGGGKFKIGPKVTVALVQSLYKCTAEVAKRIGFLIVDECHHIPSRTFTEAVGKFDAVYMLGLSATPWRRDGLSSLITWYLGDIHHQINKADLVKSGDLMKAEIIVRPTEFAPYHDPVNEYSQMLAELVADDKRNRLIASDIAREAERSPGISLVLSDRKSHCDAIRSILMDCHGLDPLLLTGDIPPAERSQTLKKLDQGKSKILIATGQLIGEGFDCKNLTTLFLTTPIKFKGRLLQYLGRILRPAPQKKEARVFDYVDIKVDVLRNAANARQQAYRS